MQLRHPWYDYSNTISQGVKTHQASCFAGLSTFLLLTPSWAISTVFCTKFSIACCNYIPHISSWNCTLWTLVSVLLLLVSYFECWKHGSWKIAFHYLLYIFKWNKDRPWHFEVGRNSSFSRSLYGFVVEIKAVPVFFLLLPSCQVRNKERNELQIL